MKITAVILAGGLGLRMGGDKPKQLLEIDGKPILVLSLEAFERHAAVDEIILVVNAAFRQDFEALLQQYNFSKLKAVVGGGKERSDSSRNALSLIDATQPAKVLIHDAVRPFVSEEIITRVIKELDSYSAVNVGVPATDTVLIANENCEITTVPQRENLFLAQTPQGFHAHVIKHAYALAAKDTGFKATDDCGVVCNYLPHIPVKVVQGAVQNRKITFPSDL